MKDHIEYTIITRGMLRDVSFYNIIFILIIVSCISIKRELEFSTIMLGFLFATTILIIPTLKYQNGFKYNRKHLIVFHPWFGYTKCKINIKDISNINIVPMLKGRYISQGVAIEFYDKKSKCYCCSSLKDNEINAMVSYINKYIIKYYLIGNENSQKEYESFKCKRIHIQPEANSVFVILLIYFALYIIASVVWWNSIVNMYGGWLFFGYFSIGILLPIFIYKSKIPKNANNIYLSDCIISISNDSTGYRKTIPFEAIKNIKYKNGIEIELNIGQKLNYKICGNQARKRLGIEKIIGEFKRFKKMMRQDVAD